MAREKKPEGFRWRLWLRLGASMLALVSAGMAARQIHRFAMANPGFRLPDLPPERDTEEFSIAGLRYASREHIVRVFGRDFGRSVFAVPLDERRRRLLAVDWVGEVSVARLWPNRIRIAVRERTPVAFVSLPQRRASARVQLIDDAGVILSRPPRAAFSFPVATSLTESEGEAARARKMAWFLMAETALRGLGVKVSEIDLASIDALKITLPVDGQALELIVGNANVAARTANFLNHYPEIRKRSPDATVFDLRLDDRIIVKE